MANELYLEDIEHFIDSQAKEKRSGYFKGYKDYTSLMNNITAIAETTAGLYGKDGESRLWVLGYAHAYIRFKAREQCEMLSKIEREIQAERTSLGDALREYAVIPQNRKQIEEE